MTRPKNKSDEVYNARRRYARQAARYMKDADTVFGAARERYIQLARSAAEKALSTFEKEPKFAKLSKGLKEVALRTDAQYTKVESKKRRKELIESSTESLQSNIENRRRYEGQKIMSSSIGSRIIASLEPIWRKFATTDDKGKTRVDWKSAEQAIFSHMSDATGREITDWLGVIEAFEENPEISADLYKEPKNNLKYDDVVQAAQRAFKI